MFEGVGGRKFVLAILLFVAFTIFVVIGKMDVSQFITAVLVDSGIFSLANVAQKFGTENKTEVK